MIFKGNCTALITPFSKTGKSIDFASLEKLLNMQLNSKSAILVLGTTGESSTLSLAEKQKLVEFVVNFVNHKVPVIVGAGSNNTKQAILNSQMFESMGIDGLLHITPFYNKASQNGMFKHFEAIAKNSKLPIILYNVPSRTGVNLLPQTVFRLSKIKNIVGIKEASGNLNQISEILSLNPNFDVYSGDDSLTLPALSIGAKGVFSVVANLKSHDVQNLCNAFFENDFKKAISIHQKLFTLSKALFCDVNPMPVKSALKILGLSNSTARLPLTHLSKKDYLTLKCILTN